MVVILYWNNTKCSCFQFVRKEEDGKIKVFANKGRDVYEYDYLIWAGNLGDFIRSQSNIIIDYKEKELFTETEEFFISSSILNMKNDIRQTASVLYLENEVLEPDNEVYADVDATPYVLVVQYIQKDCVFHTLYYRCSLRTSRTRTMARETTMWRAGPTCAR